MKIEDIKAIRTNWKPVTLYLADGRQLRVNHQDFLIQRGRLRRALTAEPRPERGL